MALIFNSNRIVEKNYREKQYFSDKPQSSFKIKCYSCLLAMMTVLFVMNIYQSLSEVAVINTFF